MYFYGNGAPKCSSDFTFPSFCAAVTATLFSSPWIWEFILEQNTKIMGVGLIILAFYTLVLPFYVTGSFLFGVIGFALLLPAGIFAI